MKIAVIGAGPAGLAVALKLVSNSIEVDVYDNDSDVGGFAKSVILWEKPVEIGPHFLTLNKLPDIEEIALDLLDGKYVFYERRTYILIDNKFFSYPPSAENLLQNLSPVQLVRLGISQLKKIIFPQKQDGTAETFVIKHLGDFLYNYFFRSYTSKLWRLEGNQIDESFAASLIGFDDGLSTLEILCKTIKRMVSKKASDSKRYIRIKGGLSVLWEAMRSKIERGGGTFFMSSSINSISASPSETGKLTHLLLQDGTIKEYDAFICTIPFQPFMKILRNEGSENKISRINFRSDILVYLKVGYESARPGQCFYVYSDDIKITRVTNFIQFDDQAKNEFSVILIEIWTGVDEAVWNYSDDELLELATSELKKTKIFNGLVVHDHTIKKIANAFQVPDLTLNENRGAILKELEAYKNLYITGRTSSINFNYGMENALDEGIRLGDKIVSAELKSINDLVYEYPNY